MATGTIKKQYRVKTQKQTVDIPTIASHAYALVAVPTPQFATGESLVGWSLMSKDGAVQVTILYNNGYYLTCYNAYSQATSASQVEIYWLVQY